MTSQDIKKRVVRLTDEVRRMRNDIDYLLRALESGEAEEKNAGVEFEEILFDAHMESDEKDVLKDMFLDLLLEVVNGEPLVTQIVYQINGVVNYLHLLGKINGNMEEKLIKMVVEIQAGKYVWKGAKQ